LAGFDSARPHIPVAGGTLRIHNQSALGTAEFQFNAASFTSIAQPDRLRNAISIGAGQLGDGAVFSGAPMEFTGSASLFKPGRRRSAQDQGE
jgi:hypothetical protein